MIVVPAFIDLHVHLREPGYEEAETVASGLSSALAGGFGTVVAMPNTFPPVDSPEQVLRLLERAGEFGRVNVLPCGCITKGRGGTERADLEAMAEAGAAAFSDDGSTVADSSIMREAMEISARLGLPVMDQDRKSVV